MYRIDLFLEKLNFYKLYFSFLTYFFSLGVFLIMINAGLILYALDQKIQIET